MRLFALPVILLASLVVGADADADAECTKPPAGAIIVDGAGDHGGYRTVSEAVDQLNYSTTETQLVFIYPGVYTERVVIKHLNGTLVLQGYTCDTMSYKSNEVTIVYKMSQILLTADGRNVSNELASTLSINTDTVQVYNLNLVNTGVHTPEKGQAPAMCAICERCTFYACSFTGHQDTLYAKKGLQLYARSHMAGTVDFIFGNARAYFQSCNIESVGQGCITANGRDSEANNSYFVFNEANVYGSPPNSTYLGRPWRAFARVLFQSSKLGDIIKPAGWTLMRPDMEQTNFDLKEYNNTGPGSNITGRVSYSGLAQNPQTIEAILGDNYGEFVDKKYL